jgi:hypothetical protein
MSNPINDILPEGFSIDSMSERELHLVEWFLEEQYDDINDRLDHIEEMLQDNDAPQAHIIINYGFRIPTSVLQRMGYVFGDEFETEFEDGALLVKLKKQPWKDPDWI